jgi:hypothetical protein
MFNVQQSEFTSDDYYTPAWIFQKMDLSFDLDVASPPGGIDYIPAARFLTQLDDGLSQDWLGRVWMNPPFSKAKIWIQKFIEHGDGVALLPMAKSNWFNELWNSPISIVALPSNLKFLKPGGITETIFLPTVLIAIGDDNVKAISKLGRVR